MHGRALRKETILARIRAGEPLHMQFVDGAQCWWLENPHTPVPDTVAAELLADGDSIVEAGDSLFGLPMNSQTFVAGGVR